MNGAATESDPVHLLASRQQGSPIAARCLQPRPSVLVTDLRMVTCPQCQLHAADDALEARRWWAKAHDDDAGPLWEWWPVGSNADPAVCLQVWATPTNWSIGLGRDGGQWWPVNQGPAGPGRPRKEERHVVYALDVGPFSVTWEHVWTRTMHGTGGGV